MMGHGYRGVLRSVVVLVTLAGLLWLFGCAPAEGPAAVITASPVSGLAPLAVRFDAYRSAAPSGQSLIAFEWDFGDGSPRSADVAPTHTYYLEGESRTFTARLTVTDSAGRRDTASQQITVAGSLPAATLLLGHTDAVRSVAFSPEGDLLATGSDDATIRFWEVPGLEDNKTLTGHHFGVLSVSFSPDGLLLASGSRDHSVRVWHVDSGMELSVISGHTQVTSVAISPDSENLAGSLSSSIYIWSMATRENLCVMRGFAGHAYQVNSVAFSPDGQRLATGSNDTTVKIWDVVRCSVVRTLREPEGVVNAVAYTPDGKLVAAASGDGWVYVWEADTGELIHRLSGHPSPVRALAFRADSRTLASGGQDGTVRLWDAFLGTHIVTLTGHTSWVHAVAFSHDGRFLAAGAQDHTTRVWDVGVIRF